MLLFLVNDQMMMFLSASVFSTQNIFMLECSCILAMIQTVTDSSAQSIDNK